MEEAGREIKETRRTSGDTQREARRRGGMRKGEKGEEDDARYPFGPFGLLCRIQLAYAWSRMSNAQRAYHKFNMPSGKAI